MWSVMCEVTLNHLRHPRCFSKPHSGNAKEFRNYVRQALCWNCDFRKCKYISQPVSMHPKPCIGGYPYDILCPGLHFRAPVAVIGRVSGVFGLLRWQFLIPSEALNRLPHIKGRAPSAFPWAGAFGGVVPRRLGATRPISEHPRGVDGEGAAMLKTFVCISVWPAAAVHDIPEVGGFARFESG